MAWDEHDAGYDIDNIAGTDKAAGIVDGVRTYPVGDIAVSNAPFLKKDENYTDIYGGRAALKIDLDNNWTITPAFMGQKTLAHGSYAENPAAGDLDVIKFGPEYSDDSWYQAALTIEGKVGNLDVTYAGAYMNRHIHSVLGIFRTIPYFYPRPVLRPNTSSTTRAISSIRSRRSSARTTSPRTARNCASPRPRPTVSAMSAASTTSSRPTRSSRITRSPTSPRTCGCRASRTRSG